MFKLGDIVFFNKAKSSYLVKAPEYGLKDRMLWFAVLLGCKKVFEPPPEQKDVVSLMASAGYLSFDSVFEFLGKEAGEECVAKFRAKYEPKPPSPVLSEETTL